MKLLLAIISILILSGCATYAPAPRYTSKLVDPQNRSDAQHKMDQFHCGDDGNGYLDTGFSESLYHACMQTKGYELVSELVSQ